SAEDREQARITALEVARQEERNRAAERIREPVSTLSQVITSLCGRSTNTGDQPNAQPAAASAALLDGDVGAPLLDAADGGGTPDFELNELDTAFFENLDGEPEAQEQQEMQQQQQRRAIPVPGKNMERARMLAEVSLSDVIRDMDSGPAPPPPPPPTEVQPAVEVSLSDLIRDMDSGPAPPPPPPPTEVQPAAANEVQQPAPLCIQLVLPNSVTGIQFSSAIHASAHDDTLQVRRFTPASRDLEPFHFLSSTKFAVLQAVEMRFDSSENNSIRAQLKFNIRMVRIKEAAVINAEDKWIACGLELLSDLRDFELWWLQQFSELERKIDAYNSNGSGWIVEQINYFDLCSALTDRIRYYRGRCANFSLPNQLAVKKAIINPPSDGNNCFLFACLAYLHIRDPGVMKSCHRLTTYSRWLDEIDLSGIALPVAISDLDVIEEKNSEICFTVFSWEDDEAYEELEQHRDSCNPQLKPAIMERMPDASSNTMQFMAWEKTISPPFVVYADFEALNTPLFISSSDKHWDHDHLSGEYKGAACASCNKLARLKRRFLPIVFHNLRGYDLHLIFSTALGDMTGWRELCSWSECRFLSLDDDAPIGYLVEADLLYPAAEIHTATEDLPFAPEKRCPNFEEFPQYMRELWVLLQHDNDHSHHHQQQQPDANTTENPTVARYRGREVLPILHAEGLLDTSNFFTNHPLFSNRLKAKLGCIKDEAGGLQQIEWVLLRPKLYSFLAESSAACKAKAKGIQRSVLKNEVSHDDYVKIFKGASKLSLTVRRIGSEKHRVFTIEQRKLALSIWEDKRAWTGSNSSLPFGHFQLLIRGSPKRTADCLE
uniref:OTU domain-containing protein n=1 Tax=Macrostomum lignano TaxID=282301 RepID=A0A1I8JAE0_9PLAT